MFTLLAYNTTIPGKGAGQQLGGSAGWLPVKCNVGEITMEIEDLILEILTYYPHLFEKAQAMLDTLLASQSSLDSDHTIA